MKVFCHQQDTTFSTVAITNSLKPLEMEILHLEQKLLVNNESSLKDAVNLK